jgi:hypothetical protein
MISLDVYHYNSLTQGSANADCPKYRIDDASVEERDGRSLD